MTRLRSFLCDDDAATAVEYAVMVALIAAVVIPAVLYLGNMASDTFNSVASEIEGVARN